MNTTIETSDHVLNSDMYDIHLSAFENHPEAMFVLDTEGFLRKCSNQTYTLFGYSAQDILGRRFGDFVPESQRTLVGELLQDALNSKQNQEFDMVYPHHNSCQRYIQTTLVPVTVRNRDWVMGYCKEITDKVHLGVSPTF